MSRSATLLAAPPPAANAHAESPKGYRLVRENNGNGDRAVSRRGVFPLGTCAIGDKS